MKLPESASVSYEFYDIVREGVEWSVAKFDFLSIFTYTIIDEEDKMSSASLILKKGKNPLSIVLFSKDIKN